MRVLMLLASVIIIAGLALACGSAGGSKALTESDAGTTIRLKAGEAFTVKLDGNPTTGYAWEPENLDTGVLQQEGDWKFAPESSAIGSGGSVTATFKAASAGTTTLRLIYHRPFETGVAPLKTWEATIVVK